MDIDLFKTILSPSTAVNKIKEGAVDAFGKLSTMIDIPGEESISRMEEPEIVLSPDKPFDILKQAP